MSIIRTLSDAFHARGDICAEHSLIAAHDTVVIGDLMLSDTGYLRAYRQKTDVIPQTVQDMDDTVDISAVSRPSIQAWNEYSISRGWTQKLLDVFPRRHRAHDFDELPIGEHSWGPVIERLQSQVDSLDDLFNTLVPYEYQSRTLHAIRTLQSVTYSH